MDLLEEFLHRPRVVGPVAGRRRPEIVKARLGLRRRPVEQPDPKGARVAFVLDVLAGIDRARPLEDRGRGDVFELLAPVDRPLETDRPDEAGRRRHVAHLADQHHARRSPLDFHFGRRMDQRRAADGPGVEIAQMRQVHQIVHHHHVVSGDAEHRAPVRPAIRPVVVWVIEDRVLVGERRIAHPDPDELLPLHHRIAAHTRVAGDTLLTRDADATPGPVVDQPVIAALDSLRHDASVGERRAAVAAPVLQRRRPAVRVAEQHDRLVHDRPGERLVADLLRPGGHIPCIPQKRRDRLDAHGGRPSRRRRFLIP